LGLVRPPLLLFPLPLPLFPSVPSQELGYGGRSGQAGARTVTHEVAHHFGIDDARLDELG